MKINQKGDKMATKKASRAEEIGLQAILDRISALEAAYQDLNDIDISIESNINTINASLQKVLDRLGLE